MKKFTFIIILLYISVSISFQGCDNSSDPEEHNNVKVNIPTNDFRVEAIISKIGMTGCTFVKVTKGDPITGAVVRISEKRLTGEDGRVYWDSSGVVDYGAGNKYDLTVTVEGEEIASGIALMPSEPLIQFPPDSFIHKLNEPLNVIWNSVAHATSIQLGISGQGHGHESAYLASNATNHTIPDSFFGSPGDYHLSISAYHGLLPGFVIDSSKGYNIEGASGYFFAAISTPQIVIRVPDSSGTILLKKDEPVETEYIFFNQWISNLRKKYFDSY